GLQRREGLGPTTASLWILAGWAPQLGSFSVNRGIVSLLGGCDITCVKCLQASCVRNRCQFLAPSLRLFLVRVSQRWFQFLPWAPLSPQHMPGPACPVHPLPPVTLSCGLSSPALTLLSSGLWAAQDPREGRSNLERKTS
ncbi:hypothetical protein E2I00_002907, partial [Balaenoptera physalus]